MQAARSLTTAAECARLGWIPVNSRFYAVRLDGSVTVNGNRLKRNCLLVESVYASTELSKAFWRKARILGPLFPFEKSRDAMTIEKLSLWIIDEGQVLERVDL